MTALPEKAPLQNGEELHQGIRHATGDQGTDGDALEEADADDRADDEGGDDVRIVLQQLDAAAARHCREDAADDSGDAERALEGVDHVGNGHVSCRDGHEDGGKEEHDAPVQSVGGQEVEHRRQAQELQDEHDEDGIGDRAVVTDDAEREDHEQHEIFRIHKAPSSCEREKTCFPVHVADKMQDISALLTV